MNGIGGHIKEVPERSLAPLPSEVTAKRWPSMNYEAGSFQAPNLPAPQSWTSQHLKLRNKWLLLIRPPFVEFCSGGLNRLRQWAIKTVAWSVMFWGGVLHSNVCPHEQAPAFGCLLDADVYIITFRRDGLIATGPHVREVFRWYTASELMKLWHGFEQGYHTGWVRIPHCLSSSC